MSGLSGCRALTKNGLNSKLSTLNTESQTCHCKRRQGLPLTLALFFLSLGLEGKTPRATARPGPAPTLALSLSVSLALACKQLPPRPERAAASQPPEALSPKVRAPPTDLGEAMAGLHAWASVSRCVGNRRGGGSRGGFGVQRVFGGSARSPSHN